MADAPLLKDYFTPQVVHDIGEQFRRVKPRLDLPAFEAFICDDSWDEQTFTGRSKRIATALVHFLDSPPSDILDMVVGVLPGPLEGGDGTFSQNYWLWPVGDVIAILALDAPEKALDACYALTSRFTSEFAIRPLLREFPKLTLERLQEWVDDPCEHVRRLVSEGTRPRLPWATRINLPLDDVLLLLAMLRADSSLYVRRSVANHMNDLCKDHPDRIIAVLSQWHAEGVTETLWIVRHALRNQLKAGEPRVLALYGYLRGVVSVRGLRLSAQSVAVGESVECLFDLVNTSGESQEVMADVVLGFVKADGSRSPKVFKFKTVMLVPGESVACAKRLVLKQLSTRRLYPGRHSVTVRVNGEDSEPVFFDLR